MGNGLAKREVLDAITAARSQFEGRLPNGMTVDKFTFGLMTAIQKNSALLNCEPKSVLLAAYEAAEVGCSLSPSLQLGWLIPYGTQAQFQPSYRFFMQKAYATECVNSFNAEVVYERDTFKRELAPKRTLIHIPADGDRGEPIGAYAIVEFKGGRLDYEFLTKEQVERHRKVSKQPNSLMWKEFFEEGWRKTAIRVLAKRLPMTNSHMEELAEIIEKDAAKDMLIPGEIELEPDSPLAAAQSEGKPDAFVVTQPAAIGITFHVGKMLTWIEGGYRALEGDFKNLGGRPDAEGRKRWTIPASLTEDLLKVCEQRGVPAVEVNEEGQPLGAANLFQD